MDDVEDIDQVAAAALEGVVYNNGQSCCAVERIYVQEAVYDQFVRAYTEQVKKMVIGDPLEAATEIGPLSRQEQRAFVSEQIGDAVGRGVSVRYGAQRLPRKDDVI